MENSYFSNLLTLGTGAPLEYNPDETFIDAFLRQVEKKPDITAVMDEYGSINYGELNELSDALAAELLEIGVNAGDFIAIKLPRVKEFMVAVLGIWKAGGAYLPLDLSYPEERIRYMLEDSGAEVVIDESWMERHQCAASVPVNKARPDGVAIIIYTSGSTGRPKGVLNTHRAVRALCNTVNFGYQYIEGEIIAEIPSFSYVISCSDLFPPLIYGHTVFILSHSFLADISALDRYIREKGITIISIVPQIGIPLINDYNTPLRRIGMGGAKVELPPKGNVRIISGYGLSETCSAVSFVDISDKPAGSCPMLGRPAPGVTIVLEDENGIPVPLGEIGEVCIGSPQVAAGYWHNEELTEKAFVKRPWSKCRVFRSGDLARWNEDGILEFHGRRDEMVKIRGNRVELGEVESVLQKVNGISDGAVAMKDVHGESLLCGYYVTSGSISPESISASMSDFLPPYMIPSFFIRMDVLPTLPNGKLDRMSLPEPDTSHARETVAPASEFEKLVFPLVCREFGNDNFGVTTNLISLGLTSLLAIKLSAALKKELGIAISQSDMLAHPVIREWESLNREETAAISVEPSRGYYPLTDNQMGVYIEWERNHLTDQYNLPFVIKLKGGDAQKLLASVQETIKLYPILKMRLAEQDGIVAQMRRDNADLPVGFEKLDFEPEDDFFRKLVRPFNLMGEDLARIRVYSSPSAVWLFFDVHHIVFDGGSLNLFIRNLSTLYSGGTPLPESVTVYDYALYREHWKETEEYAEYGNYFGRILDGIESFTYPSSVNGMASGSLGKVTVTIPRREIRKFCLDCSVTENSFFATVLTQVFHRVSRENSIQIAMFSSGRSMTQLTGSIGMFVQTLPLVSRAADATVGETLRLIHSQIVGTLSRDRYPYTLLAERYGLIPNVMYVYQGDVIDYPDFGGAEYELHRLPVSAAVSPLTVEILPVEEEYRIKFEYDEGLYGERDIVLLSGAVRTLAEGMAKSLDAAPLGSLSIVSDEEKASLLSLGAGEKLEYDRSETFINMFLRRTSLTQDADAVVDSKSSLSYRELDSASDALAAKLASDGVNTGDFVAVKMPRVKEFVVAVLGIWKAGAAYVPVDPEYPSERISYMLDDSGAKVVIDEEYFDNIAPDNMNPFNLARPENPAYMIYTSGSTGKPKGVVVTHANLRAFMAWLPAELELKPGEAVAHHVSFSFDGSVCDLYSSLASGATLHILSSELRKDLDGLSKYLEEHHIVGSSISTQLGMELLNTCDLKMRYMVLGGEKLKQVRRTSVRLYNSYGPTEFTVWSSHHIVNQAEDGENIPIGRPVPNSVCLILDASGNMMPRGTAGELCLSGEQLSSGYWHRPELTEKAFVPCKALEGAKIYHTGDLVRWNEEGNLEYLGRIDRQVKLRGFRIEMGEVEAALSKFDGITSAVAEVKTVNGIQHLCAYYVADDAIDETVLKSVLLTSLAAYMVPDMYFRMEALPLTPNGKVDRKALPEPEFKPAEMVPAATRKEEILLQIARKMLGTDDFGVTDSLVDYGMTSISSIKFVAAAMKEGITLKAGVVLRNPTVRAMASSLLAFGSWNAPYEDGKQVMVFICGVTTWLQSSALLESLTKRYNVFVFEAIQEHFEAVFARDNVDDVIMLYSAYLEQMLQEGVKVSVFAGHSFGGELAVRMAAEREKVTGEKPSVYLWDTWLVKEININPTEVGIEAIMNATDHQIDVMDEQIRCMDIIGRLKKGASPLPVLTGQITYYRAIRTIGDFKSNQVALSALFPNLRIIDIDADHFSILSSDNAEMCLKLLRESQ